MKKELTYSFVSPKGGVGRTLTLANIANIYSNGATWAGLHKSSVLVLDLDFNAPGIHYYDFAKANNLDIQDNKPYLLNGKSFNKKEIDNELKKYDTGLAFYFRELISNQDYVQICEEVIELLETDEKDSAIKSFKEYLFEEVFKSKEFNPLNHLISIENKSIFYYPAGSPRNSNYNTIFFSFNWLDFLNYYLGDYVLKYLIEFTNKYLDKKYSNNETLRVLLDQQAGVSIPGLINRSLADANIYISGFNEQNKSGLENLVYNHIALEDKSLPWIILNQYDLRDDCFKINSSIIDSGDSPHKKFKEKDNEKRKEFVTKINRLLFFGNAEKQNDETNRIFVTDFSTDAIQNEFFYKENSIAYKTLVETIVNIEKENLPQKDTLLTTSIPYHSQTIKFLGEKVQPLGESGKFYGPFYSLLKIMSEYFGTKTKIIAYAASHEQIAQLIIKGEINGFSYTEYNEDNYQIISLNTSEGQGILKLDEFDIISYPFYLKQELSDNILHSFQIGNTEEIPTTDSLDYISNSYLCENVVGWEKYGSKSEITDGVPLFVTPQLLAYLNKNINKHSDFQEIFHKAFLRHFNGFNEPNDLLNYAETIQNSPNKFKDILLCSNDCIPKFYEWLTISSIFNFQESIEEITSKEKFIDYFFTDGGLRALFSYIKLYVLAEKTTIQNEQEGRDWDILLKEFFLEENSSAIFLWADTIPENYREKDTFIYQLPPAFHYFEECWRLSIIKKEKNIGLENFLISFLSKNIQQKNLKYGGIPVHKSVISNISNWNTYPFLPHIWASRNTENIKKLINKTSFEGYYELSLIIPNLLTNITNSAKKLEIVDDIFNNEVLIKLKNILIKEFLNTKNSEIEEIIKNKYNE